MPISESLKDDRRPKVYVSISPRKNQPATSTRDSSLKRRLVIITEIIAPYRIPVFNALAENDDIALHVIFLSENDPTMRQWHIYKDEIRFSYEVLASRRWEIAGYKLLVNHGITRALRTAAPEVVVCGGYNYLASWQTLSWAKKQHVPLLLWSESNSRDVRLNNPAVEFLKKRFLAACRGFVVPGISPKAYLEELGVGDRPIFTAPNAVDNAFFGKKGQEAKEAEAMVRARHGLPARFFLCVGRLIPPKGVFDLLEAYAQLDPSLRTEVGLVFVGDGSAREELIERARQIQPGTVQCFGFTHREELPEFYGLAEAFVFPTHSDPWGLVVNEAMACGLPIVASSVAGCVPDLVEDAWNGFVLPPGKVAPLVGAMEILATQPDLREKMAMRSSERIQHYSPRAWASGMAEVARLTTPDSA